MPFVRVSIFVITRDVVFVQSTWFHFPSLVLHSCILMILNPLQVRRVPSQSSDQFGSLQGNIIVFLRLFFQLVPLQWAYVWSKKVFGSTFRLSIHSAILIPKSCLSCFPYRWRRTGLPRSSRKRKHWPNDWNWLLRQPKSTQPRKKRLKQSKYTCCL